MSRRKLKINKKSKFAPPEARNPDVLLINPPGDRLQGRYRGHFPLGLASLAGSLKSAGIKTAVYNAEAPRNPGEVKHLRQSEMCRAHPGYLRALDDPDHPVWREAERVLRSVRPALVGVTVLTEKFEAARIISRISKVVHPSTPVIWGGPHPTARSLECCALPEVNFVVKGEGERTMADLATHLLSTGTIPVSLPGVFRMSEEGDELLGAERPLEVDLDLLPSPDWDSCLSAQDWPERFGSIQEILTSRGCPYRCQYCSVSSIWGRKVRFYSIGRIFQKIERLMRINGSRCFNFFDDSFTLKRHRTEEFCNSLIREGLKIDWACLTRPDLVDVSLLRLLKRAGCRSVTFGVESASSRILELIRKGHTVEDTNRTLAACQEVGMTFNAYYMIGLPDETEEEIEMTVEHMRQSGANYVSLNTFTPYPGSALFEKVMEMGLLEEPPDWGRYGRHSMDNHFAVMIPKERFQRIVDRAYLEVDKINGTLLKKFKRYAVGSKMRLRHFIASHKRASKSL